MFALFAGASGGPATADDAESYAAYIGNPNFPIFADANNVIVDATPMTQESYPEVCVIAPDMSLVQCYAGHGFVEAALDDVKAHASQ
jgi:hypothetical protein